ncbi:chloride/fluoride channel protein [Anaerotignum neopropionicum]|uniref:Chloride/fluoride channel protein n=1 Tax=Anaerotignum neopropionicum TaxID=36847 RepID=A0A136WF13_9FIRM|nr:chloride channel protein [Anaerotignum neopropionicum]KXL53085.1 chloride/fluoride channel protein [Anaerotignum neopropionicum]
MLRKIVREYKEILLYSLIALFVGVIIGGIDAIFGEVLIKITEIRRDNVLTLVPFLPISGILIMLLYRYFSKESLKGMTLVFQTGHGNNDRIPKMLVPLIMVTTWITHLFGGSAGREGVAVQLGATIAHTLAKKLKFLKNSRVLLVIGMAAGFAGLFQTPLAATFFALEVLVSGVFLYEALLPALVASFAASTTSNLLGLEKFAVDIPNVLSFSPEILLKLIFVGALFGIVGGSFAYLLSYSKKKLATFIESPLKRIFIAGCILSLLLLLLHTGRYCGLGTNLISLSFSEKEIFGYDWLLKFLLTVLTLAAGFQGGEVTPLFSIGASLGVILGSLLGLPTMLIAALGYAAVFGSATNTLLAPILIGAEVFGAQNTLFFVIVCSLAFIFNGNKTIYSAQKRFNFFSNENVEV